MQLQRRTKLPCIASSTPSFTGTEETHRRANVAAQPMFQARINQIALVSPRSSLESLLMKAGWLLLFRVLHFLAGFMLGIRGACDCVSSPADDVRGDRSESRIERARGFGLLFG